MVIHELKSWKHFFQAIKGKLKLHDLRLNDRDYKVGDLLVLMEYDFEKGEYTGDQVSAEVTYLTNNQFPCAYSSSVLPKEYCILSLKVQDNE